MKFAILLAVGLLACGNAGAEDFFPPNPGAGDELFHDQEIQVSAFGAYGIGGNGTNRVTRKVPNDKAGDDRRAAVNPTSGVTFNPYKNDDSAGKDSYTTKSFNEPVSGLFGGRESFGGGISATGFFKRYFGFGIEMDGLAGARAVSLAGGKLLVRYPVATTFLGAPRGIAPYIFAAGGGSFDSGATAIGQAGLGLEFRLRPGFSVFIDGAYVYSRNESGELIRIGLVFTFY